VPRRNDNPLAPRILAVVALAIGAIAFARCTAACTPSLRVGTYNIRTFGSTKTKTDMKRLVAIVEEANADVLALQEIQAVPPARELARRLSHDGRSFTLTLTKCGGKSEMLVGFLYDTKKVSLAKTREYPELDPDVDERECGVERSGLAARFDRLDGGRSFQLLVVHMAAKPEMFERRKLQWQRAHKIAAGLAKEGPVAILGDTNSTGFLDDAAKERTFILEQAKNAGLDVATQDLRCTEYFGPEDNLSPSVLDHFVATPGFAASRSVRVHSFCAALGCARPKEAPEEYRTVSDHCPVTLDVSR
jgi:endonuclease/exonuclease/phosphatase family metal-dependent hydrolase